MSKARDLADLLDANGDVELDALDNAPSGSAKNLIINGAMQVAQRGTSSTATSYQTVDRIQPVYSGGSLTQSQDTNAPDGFSNSFKWSCSTAATPLTSGQYAAWYYKFEGQDLQQLKYGTASAQSVTLSFWVKSNLTGTFQVNLENQDNSRRYGETYTVNAADTWEYKTVTYSGDTVGALDNDNASSLRLEFWVAAGSTWTGGSASQAWEANNDSNRAGSLTASLLSSTSNYIQYSGLQLEVGTVATPFEHRSYGEELALCQRYYTEFGNHTVFAGRAYGSADLLISAVCPVPLRASPTVGGSGDMKVFGATVSDAVAMSAVGAFQFTANTNKVALAINTYSGLSDNRVANTGITNSGTLTLDAEL